MALGDTNHFDTDSDDQEGIEDNMKDAEENDETEEDQKDDAAETCSKRQ